MVSDATRQRRAQVNSDTELLELALARLALDGDFDSRLVSRKGKHSGGLLAGKGARCAVLTGNVMDFDYLGQLVPSVRVLLYRQQAVPSSAGA